MQFHFRISHNAYSLTPEVCLDKDLLFLNLLSDDNALSDYYSLGDHQFLFQNGNGEGAIWEGLYFPRVFLIRVNVLHLNVLNIPRKMLSHVFRADIFADPPYPRLAEVLGSPLALLTSHCLSFLLYFRIARLTHIPPTKQIMCTLFALTSATSEPRHEMATTNG
jgi:hypothetical protein